MYMHPCSQCSFEYLGNFRMFLILLQNIDNLCMLFVHPNCQSGLDCGLEGCVGSPGVVNTKNSEILNVCVCLWLNLVFFPFIAEYLPELHTCKLVPSASKLCVPISCFTRWRGLVTHEIQCFVTILSCSTVRLQSL